MQGSIRLFRLFGIEIGAHWSWFLIFLFLSWSLAANLFAESFPDWTAQQRWIAGILTSLLFFGSVLLHELSHSLVARHLGLPVSSINLFIFGGVSNLEREPESARDEFMVAIVGPGTSFVLAGVFAIIWLIFRPINNAIELIAGYLAFINGILGVFNLIPGFPLDGGRVLRSIVWALNRNLLRATRIASQAGVFVAYGLMAVGVLMIFTVALISGVWFIFIGWFLLNAAQSSYRQMVLENVLKGVTVESLIDPVFTPISPELTLRDLADKYILAQGQRYFPVMTGGDSLLGLVTLTDMKKADPDAWASTTVYRVMTPAERLLVVSPNHDTLAALQLMAQHDIHQLPVVTRDGSLRGFITRNAILRLIQIRAEIGQTG